MVYWMEIGYSQLQTLKSDEKIWIINQVDVELQSKLYNFKSHLQIFLFCQKMSQHTLKHQGKDTRAGKIIRATPSKVNSQLPCEEEEIHLNDLHDCFHFNFPREQLIKWIAYSFSDLQLKSHSYCNAVCFWSLWKGWKGPKFLEGRPVLMIKLINSILENVLM